MATYTLRSTYGKNGIEELQAIQEVQEEEVQCPARQARNLLSLAIATRILDHASAEGIPVIEYLALEEERARDRVRNVTRTRWPESCPDCGGTHCNTCHHTGIAHCEHPHHGPASARVWVLREKHESTVGVRFSTEHYLCPACLDDAATSGILLKISASETGPEGMVTGGPYCECQTFSINHLSAKAVVTGHRGHDPNVRVTLPGNFDVIISAAMALELGSRLISAGSFVAASAESGEE